MRGALIGIGVGLLAGVWLWPLPQMDLPPFSAHMTMHMVVVAVAAPLIAFGVAGGRLDPVRRWPWAFAAIPASLVELVGVWAWHTPALHHAARSRTSGLVAEQVTFLTAGLLLWMAVVCGTEQQRRERAAKGVTALLLTSMHMTLLGALFVLTPRVLFDQPPGGVPAHGMPAHALADRDRAGARAQAAGLTPAQDQQLGGALMLLIGGFTYLAGGLWLTAEVLHDRRARA